MRTRAALEARLLADDDGARRLADLLHLAELLDCSTAHTIPGLLAVLTDHDQDEETDAIRIESDEQAVRVMTLHAAKGLEFPVVLLPETDGTAAWLSRPFTIIEDNRRHLYIGDPRGGATRSPGTSRRRPSRRSCGCSTWG
nr:3'-5' exonuclease [Tessaracoccus coleopterorum]